MEDGVISVFAPQQAYQQVRDALVALYPNVEFLEDHTTWVPSSYVQLAEDHDKQKYERFIEMLDDCDDVQDYYHNIKFDEEYRLSDKAARPVSYKDCGELIRDVSLKYPPNQRDAGPMPHTENTQESKKILRVK